MERQDALENQAKKVSGMAEKKEKDSKASGWQKKLLLFGLIFVIGLIVGAYLGAEIVYPVLKGGALSAQQSELAACKLLREENDCLLQKCSASVVEKCGSE